MTNLSELVAERSRDEYEKRCLRDVNANRWFWKNRTTCFDLLDVVSWYLCTGWPTSKMAEFIKANEPESGWSEDGEPWHTPPTQAHVQHNFRLPDFIYNHVQI